VAIRAARTRLRLRQRAHARAEKVERARHGKARHWRTIIGRFVLAWILLIVAGLGAAAWRIRQGPVAADAITERVVSALEAQFGAGYDVGVRQAQVEWSDDGPLLAVSGITVRDRLGNLVVAAPQADITFDPMGLFGWQLKPKDISFVGLAVSLTIAPDGAVSVSASGEEEPAPEANQQTPAQPRAGFGPAQFIDAFAGHEGPLAVLERAGIRDGRLRINDQRRNRTVVYDRTSITFARPQENTVRMTVGVNGPLGAWSARAFLTGKPAERRDLRVEVDNLSVGEFLGFAEPGSLPASTDMPLSGHVALTLAPDNSVTTFEGRITGGSAIVMFTDPDAEPIFVDSVRGAFGWDAVGHAILVNDLSVEAGDTRWRLAGRIEVPQTDGAQWKVALSSSDSMMSADRPSDAPVAIDRVLFEGRLPIGLSGLEIDRLEVAGPQAGIAITGAIGRIDAFNGLRLGVTASRMPVRNLLAFWPSPVAADVRTWLLESAEAGTVERFALAVSLTSEALAAAFDKKPVPDEAVRLDVAVSDGVLRPGPGLPVISDLAATARVTGLTAKVQASRGTVGSAGRILTLANGRFDVDDTSQHPPRGLLAFDAAGAAEAMVDVLRSDALRPFVALPSDVSAVKGQLDTKVRVQFPLDAVIKPKDVAMSVTGQATGVSADGLFGREKLEGATFTFSQDRSGSLQVSGEGKLGGTPALFDMKQAAGSAVSDVTVTTTFDEAARNRRGIKIPGVSGPIDLKIVVRDAGAPKPVVRIDADLAKAVVNDALPGWSKAAGKAAKASFRLDQDGDATLIEDLSLDAAGGVQLRGALKLATDGALVSARMTSVRLSPQDDMKVDLDRSGNLIKATVRAASIDARPLLRALMSPGGQSVGNPGDLDLDLNARSILGENNEKLTASELKMALRGGEIREFRLAGRFGNSPVSGQQARAETGQPGIVVESGDAGTFLRFLDTYRRMLGGTLIVQLFGSPPAMSGAIIANNFILANEPALARTAGVESGKPANVAFTKLKGNFSVGGGKLDIRDGTMWGTAVGGTIDGTMDFNRDRLDLSGTFVPAYGLNNALNRVPIVGTILGGGQNEGIFAVNFRITGRLSQPTLSINPLSAVAPGVLRKFFGVFTPAEASAPPERNAPAATESIPQPSPQR
jgi:hypothetical protein